MDLKSFVIELTADGSPTLRLKDSSLSSSEKPAESMHHSAGAASETAYIYTQPFQRGLELNTEKNNESFYVAVVGLGLGYIEISFLLSFIGSQKIDSKKKIVLESFEKEQELILNFKNWLNDQPTLLPYDLILSKIIEKNDQIINIDFAKNKIQNLMRHPHENFQWIMRSVLDSNTEVFRKYHFVAYDAFSQYTDGPLWTEEFLDFFIKHFCDHNCIFTTYACTGKLKRALEKNHFKFIKRKGFNGKRDATLALRGEFITLKEFFL